MQTDLREEIARTVDPEAFDTTDCDYPAAETRAALRQMASYAKADKILPLIAQAEARGEARMQLDFRPQIAAMELGPEPSLRELVRHYYAARIDDEAIVCQCVEQYIEALSRSLPIQEEG